MKAEIKLGPKEVEEIIRDYIKRETNHAVHSIRFDVDQGYEDRPGFSVGPCLREVVISVQLEGNRKLPDPPAPPPTRKIKSGLV